MEPPDEINVNMLDENDVKKCVSDMIFSIIGDQRIPYDKIADYIVGDDDSASMEVLMATLNSMRLIHKESNKLDKKKLYVLLSTLKMSGMTVFDVEKFRQNEKMGFTYAKNGKSYSFICDVCDKNIGKNNKSKHRNVCPVIKPDDNCERCGMNVNFHPFVDKKTGRNRFCPMEEIGCEFCGNVVLKSEYFMFHKITCGNVEDKQCVFCFNKFSRNQILEHIEHCGNRNTHFAACKSECRLSDKENVIDSVSKCREEMEQKIMNFIKSWMDDVINVYLKVYKNDILVHFQASKHYRGYRNCPPLDLLDLIEKNTPGYGNDPLAPVKVRIAVEKGRIDETYKILDTCRFFRGRTGITNEFTEILNDSLIVFKAGISAGIFVFTLSCEIPSISQFTKYLVIRHHKGEYKDDHLDSILDNESHKFKDVFIKTNFIG